MARLHLHVSPGSKRNELERQTNGVLRVYVTARATEGKANQALVALLADRLDIPKSFISIKRGEASRHKTVEVAGLEDDELLARLNASEKES
jgi:uncharacterized protein (TIGR00251 family)